LTGDEPLYEREKKQVLRAIWRDRMHVEPDALQHSSSRIQERYEHVWQPVEEWSSQLTALPLGLLDLWHRSGRGHLVFTHERTAYVPDHVGWRDTTLSGVCYLCVADLQDDWLQAMSAQGCLLDHLMGSGLVPGGAWLSDGGGLNAALAEVAQRFRDIHALAYGVEELAAPTAREYFARGLATYIHNPGWLNVLDPLLFKLFRGTLMSESAWQRLA